MSYCLGQYTPGADQGVLQNANSTRRSLDAHFAAFQDPQGTGRQEEA